jgi:hypothetical protein
VEATEAAEAEGCIGGAVCIRSIRMHQKSMEADGASSEYKVSEVVKAVRTCQNSLGQDGICLRLLLLHVGPNGDKFGGQAFMEHYIGLLMRTTVGIRNIQVFWWSITSNIIIKHCFDG